MPMGLWGGIGIKGNTWGLSETPNQGHDLPHLQVDIAQVNRLQV